MNSLFKVLFNFPSRYLFAIGLAAVFSLGWRLPPALSCTLKQLDSRESPSHASAYPERASHPLWEKTAFQRTWSGALERGADLPEHHIPCRRIDGGFGAGLFPVRSPLLGESSLVSFPPLNDMLKFSGYSRLIRGPTERRYEKHEMTGAARRPPPLDPPARVSTAPDAKRIPPAGREKLGVTAHGVRRRQRRRRKSRRAAARRASGLRLQKTRLPSASFRSRDHATFAASPERETTSDAKSDARTRPRRVRCEQTLEQAWPRHRCQGRNMRSNCGGFLAPCNSPCFTELAPSFLDLRAE